MSYEDFYYSMEDFEDLSVLYMDAYSSMSMTMSDTKKLEEPEFLEFTPNIPGASSFDFLKQSNSARTFTSGDINRDIGYDHVRQYGKGTCSFLSALAAMAAQPNQRAKIRDMITDIGAGNYTVKFPGGDRAVTVYLNPSDRTSAFSDTGNWVRILELAYCEYIGNPKGTGKSSGFALELLTGKSVDEDTIALSSPGETHGKIIMALENGRPVTAGLGQNVLFGETNEEFYKRTGLAMKHAYAITYYDRENKRLKIYDTNKEIEPSNSRGEPLDGRRDGEFWMSLDDFMKYFSFIYYTEK